jgi:hypothetical protein
MKTYAVFYANMDAFKEAHGGPLREGGGLVAMPKSRFEEAYHFVGTHAAKDVDELFALLNDAREHEGIPNPLGSPKIQELVISHYAGGPGHTSMSVGDVAIDLEEQKVLMCASTGWSELELV